MGLLGGHTQAKTSFIPLAFTFPCPSSTKLPGASCCKDASLAGRDYVLEIGWGWMMGCHKQLQTKLILAAYLKGYLGGSGCLHSYVLAQHMTRLVARRGVYRWPFKLHAIPGCSFARANVAPGPWPSTCPCAWHCAGPDKDNITCTENHSPCGVPSPALHPGCSNVSPWVGEM